MYGDGVRAIVVCLFLSLLFAPAIRAQTADEKAYFAARQQLTAEFEARRRSLPVPIDESAWNREEEHGHDVLRARLNRVIGPAPPPPGFTVARSNPDPLCCGPDADSLDALVISNGRIRAVMTTEGLMRLWLGRDPASALQGDDVDYFRALNTDAPVEVFAPLPVVVPAGADLALGRLVVKGRGVSFLPLHVVVAAAKAGRILLAMTPASLEAADAGAPCEVLWQQSVERYRTADDLDARRAISAESARQLEQCMRGHEGQVLFPGLGGRAQKLVDTLTAD